MFEQKISDIKIVEVGPRDGLQNEKKIIPTKDKSVFIQKLAKAGLKNIEVTSFVKPSAIAQMKDAVELFGQIKNILEKSVHLSALVPNEIGYEKAKPFDIQEVAFFTATSDTFNQKNINATIEESFERIIPVAKMAKADGKKIRVYLSTAFGCPYEGEVKQEKVLKLYRRCLKDFYADEIAISDTIGVATPLQVNKMLKSLKQEFGLKQSALHFHDTRGMALANVLVGLENGVTTFDSAAGGLGGCPYAKGATGNLATEDLVYLLESLGVKTGIDMEALVAASEFIFSKVGKESTSKYLVSYLKSRENE